MRHCGIDCRTGLTGSKRTQGRLDVGPRAHGMSIAGVTCEKKAHDRAGPAWIVAGDAWNRGPGQLVSVGDRDPRHAEEQPGILPQQSSGGWPQLVMQAGREPWIERGRDEQLDHLIHRCRREKRGQQPSRADRADLGQDGQVGRRDVGRRKDSGVSQRRDQLGTESRPEAGVAEGDEYRVGIAQRPASG